MRYMLVNTSLDNILLNLYSPEKSPRHRINRPGPTVSLNIGRGQCVDLLKYVKSVEEAHTCIMNSHDARKLVKPGMIVPYICTDSGEQIDFEFITELTKSQSVTTLPVAEYTKPGKTINTITVTK